MPGLKEMYETIGGRFICQPEELKKKLNGTRAFVLDWDGVFNNGQKQSSGGSHFSEVDSMGLNLLRFSYFLRNGELPVTAMISGETNETALFYAERENFHHCFYKVAHKIHALEHLCRQENLEPAQVAYFFDDVLDLPIAEKCGLRIMVNQRANPLFTDYAVRNNCADYITASRGGEFAVREACELLIALGGNFDAVLDARTRNTKDYQRYITARRKNAPRFFTLRDAIEEADPRKS